MAYPFIKFLSTRVRWPLPKLAVVSLIAVGPSLAILVALLWPADGWIDQWGFMIGRDFVNFWMAGRLAAEGRIGEIYDLTAYHQALRATLAPAHPFMNFSYLPNTLPLVRPLGSLPYGVALGLWQMAGLAAFTFAATGALWPRDRARAALILLSPLVIVVFCFAQATLLLALLFVGAFRLLPTRPLLAGVLFGLLTVKPQLGVLIPFALVLERQWTAIACAAASAIALAGLSVVLYGLAPWHDYFANTVPYQAAVIAQPFGLVWTMLITPYAFLAKVGVPIVLALKVQATVALVVAATALYTVRQTQELSAKAAIVALAAMLSMPYCLVYDLAIPAAAIIWYLGERDRVLNSWQSAALALFWGAPVVLLPLSMMDIPVLPPLVALMFAALVWKCLQDRETAGFAGGKDMLGLRARLAAPV